MSEYTGDYDVLVTYDETNPETGEVERSAEVRQYGSRVVVVNLVMLPFVRSDPEYDEEDYDFVVADDDEGSIVVADMSVDQFGELAEALDSVFISDGDVIDPPQGDDWEVGFHPLTGQLVFQRTDGATGHLAVAPEDAENFAQDVLDSQVASA